MSALLAFVAVAGMVALYYLHSFAPVDSAGFSARQYAGLLTLCDTLAPAEPGQWRYGSTESAQPYEAFAAQSWPRPSSARRALALLELDNVAGHNGPAYKDIAAFTRAFFMLPAITFDPAPLDTTAVVRRACPHVGHLQMLTGDILHALESLAPDSAFCFAALSRQDLYADPSWEFVFGEADLAARVAVVSCARLDPEYYGGSTADSATVSRVILRRVCKVLSHELCHTFGLMHCVQYRCLMNGANDIAESDAKPAGLCAVCLRKLQHSIGFDVVERFDTLEAFYAGRGMGVEVAEVRRHREAVVSR